jgi:protein-L-isoaspartate(D-aspartate) O-methyltransferase
MGSGALNKEYLLDDLRGLVSEPVIMAMSRVPRELFVPEHLERRAYDDTPLPIGLDQTISAPHMVAVMCELLDLRPGMKVLEVGGGSGYHAAVLAVLVGPKGHVYSVERKPELVVQARKNLEKAGIMNVSMIEADGSLGLPEHAPYDRISVAAAAPQIPESLKQQLIVGGKMVLPVGRYRQELLLVTRKDDGFEVEAKMGVVFVPLIGVEGFKEQQI